MIASELSLDSLNRLKDFVHSARRLLLITGAGISTESGIPDYRSPGRPPHKPMTHSTFMSAESARKRYWTRSFLGFPKIARAKPNPGHLSVAHGERQALIHHIITQNVDGLHQSAGAHRVTELHGSLHSVTCMHCKSTTPRSAMQQRLFDLNAHLRPLVGDSDSVRPDGDIQIDAALSEQLTIPPCELCGGILKPHVVFFGASVPPAVNQEVDEVVSEADRILVAGSSLAVWSAFRLVRAANMRSNPAPIAILNRGPTRADPMASFKIEAPLGEALAAVFDLPTEDFARAATPAIETIPTAQMESHGS